ncbi:uncharacterized protein B0H18DRAFT_1130672 [Fomitopsis serialis]|uniref:uncharacterized protein n=1 Tax=Fomitopsis serialis TaxID=139415 RepID=UPI0020088B45|nr:uncharacterized protein B0H18DRAFT_1130672 [Neoantrodia serialis]KAH9910155.1 hypothetical protein B0H18DRAFT_1130672 [Neoantrodia serialis]
MHPFRSPTFRPLGTFRDRDTDDWSDLPDSPPSDNKLPSSASPKNILWDFRDLAAPSSPPTSVDDEDYVDAVRHWPFARRIFGDLLDDRDFPALSDILIQTPDFEPEDWVLLQTKLRDKPEILRHFWFRYDRAMKTVVSGSPSGLHQDALQGCVHNIVEETIKPVTVQFPLPAGMLVTENTAKMLVRQDHIEIPDCMVGLSYHAKRKDLSVSLGADCAVVESARTESVPHVLAKVSTTYSLTFC